MTISNAYQFNLPQYDTTIPKISFSVNIHGVVIQFTFEWFNNQWNGWATFNGETRLLGVIPYIMNWLIYQDYIILFDTPLDEIGQSDLINVNIWIFTWQ